MTKRERLIELLKKGWLSHWKACYLLKSAHADREIRYIREAPPEGYIIEERTKKAKIKKQTIVYKEFRLTEQN